MEMTIDQLARRVDMSTRNIREWQRQGLIAPPTRRGRIGIYVDEHVSRIERVKKLHAEGLPLDLIRRLSDTGTGSETDIRHLADEVLKPIASVHSRTLTRDEVVELLGAHGSETLLAMGILTATANSNDAIVVRDAVTLELISELAKVGISPERLVPALKEVQSLQREIARLVIEVYRTDVWEPFVASGFSGRDWGSIADDVARAKPVAIQLLAHLLDAAFDDVAGSVLVREANDAEHALDQS